jgi:monofunctional glycosyltransferase
VADSIVCMASRTGRVRKERKEKATQDALKPNRWPRRLKRAGLVVGVLVAVCALLFGIGWLVTPSVSDAPDLVLSEATANHIPYPGAAVPPNFARALIATEDKRFYSEPGVDLLAVARVTWSKVEGSTTDQGGATIEQQLAKMLYTPNRAGWTVELEQVMLALKLNLAYSKTQILQMYSEVAYYGHGFYGLQDASCGYFGEQPAKLSVVQAAMLAGVVNAPTFDDPILHPAAARARLEHVISRMVAVGYLTVPQAAEALDTPLRLVSVPGCR